jgi:hypothetical protein
MIYYAYGGPLATAMQPIQGSNVDYLWKSGISSSFYRRFSPGWAKIVDKK